MDLEKLSFLTKNLLKNRSSEQPELDPSQLYNPITWTSGDVINAENLNNYEETLYMYASYLLYIMYYLPSFGLPTYVEDPIRTVNNTYSDKTFPSIFTSDLGTYLGFNITEEYPVHFILTANNSKEINDLSEEMTFKIENFSSEIASLLPDSLQVTFIGAHYKEGTYFSCGNRNNEERILNKSSETGIYTGNINDASTIGNVMSFDPSTGIFTTDLGTRNPTTPGYDNKENMEGFELTHIILTAKIPSCTVLKNLNGENLHSSVSYLIDKNNNEKIKIICSAFEDNLGMSGNKNDMPLFYENYLRCINNGTNWLQGYKIPKTLNQE